VNAAAGDYLTVGDGVDAGVDSGVATDIQGVARPQGAGYDLGAYEAADDSLSALDIEPGELAPVFVSTTTSYTTEVPFGTTTAVVTATTSDVSATVSYSSTGGVCTPGNASPSTCALTAPGVTTITVMVTAIDGRTKVYTVEVTVPPSRDASLFEMMIDPGPAAGGTGLVPAFVSTTKSYTAAVPLGTTTAVVTATVNQVSATVSYSSTGGVCTPGNASPSTCALTAPGVTTITVRTTAQDGVTTDVYTVVVTSPPSNDANLLDLDIEPGSLSPAFVSTTTDYTARVPDGTASVLVTATTSDVSATIAYVTTAGSCTPGNASPSTCDIAPSGTTTITITITAADGTTKIYTIVVTVAPAGASSDASLLDLDIEPGELSPAFVSTTTSYTAELPIGTTSAVVTATTSDVSATITYASTAGECTPGNASPSSCDIAFSGTTTITITITAADGTTQEYVIVVTVEEFTGPHIAEMAIDIPGLTPAFVSTTLQYQTEVPSGTNQLVVTPTLSISATAAYSSTAGACVDSGVSGTCPLFPTETTTVTIGITDGATTRNYTIRATRATASDGGRRYWFPIVPLQE
jgi:hypothetical protein